MGPKGQVNFCLMPPATHDFVLKGEETVGEFEVKRPSCGVNLFQGCHILSHFPRGDP